MKHQYIGASAFECGNDSACVEIKSNKLILIISRRFLFCQQQKAPAEIVGKGLDLHGEKQRKNPDEAIVLQLFDFCSLNVSFFLFQAQELDF